VEQKIEIAACDRKYWEFVRLLRLNNNVSDGFIEKTNITRHQQESYMKQHSDCFRIALYNNQPAGYIGVINDDIRICTHPSFQRKGVGKFLIEESIKIWPTAFAKIKLSNKASQKLFESCGYEPKFLIYYKK